MKSAIRNPQSSIQTPAVAFVFAALLFLSTLVFFGASFDPFEPAKTFIVRVFCLGLCLLWITDALLLRRVAVLSTRAFAPMILLSLWAAASFFFARQPFFVLNELLKIGCGFLVYFFALHFVRGRGGAVFVLNAAMLASLGVCAFALLEMRGRDWFPWDYLLINPMYSVFSDYGPARYIALAWDNTFAGRVASTIGNPVYMAGYVVLLLPVAAALFVTAKRRAGAALALAAAAALAFCLIVGFSRSAWAVCAVSLLVFAALSVRGAARGARRAFFRRGAVLLVLFIALAALFAFRNPLNTTSFTVTRRVADFSVRSDSSSRERFLIWKTSLEMARVHPVRGVGLGHFALVYPEYVKRFLDNPQWLPHLSFPTRAHNDYLEMLAECGIPGLLLFVWAVIAIIAPGFTAIEKTGRPRKAGTGTLDGGGAGGSDEEIVQTRKAGTGTAKEPPYQSPFFAKLFVKKAENIASGQIDIPLEKPDHQITSPPDHQTTRLPDHQVLTAGLTSGLLAAALYANFQFPFHTEPTAVHFWVFGGLLAGLVERGARGRTERVAARFPGDARPAERILILALAAVIFGLGVRLAAQPLRGHLLFGRGIAAERNSGGGQPDYVLDLLEQGRGAFPYDPEMCIEFTNVLLLRARAQTLPEPALKFFGDVADRYGWDALWSGRLPAEMPGPYAGKPAPLKIAYLANTVRVANQCLALAPSDARAWAALARVHIELHIAGNAADLYRKALSYNPVFSEWIYNMGIASLYQGRYNEAAKQFERCLELAPDFYPAYLNLGRAREGQGRPRAALDAYNRARKRGGAPAYMHRAAGTALREMGRSREAEDAYKDALKKDSNFLAARGDLAVLYIKTGRPGKARPILEDITKKAAGDPALQSAALYHLAAVYDALKMPDKAEEARRRLDRLTRDNRGARPKEVPNDNAFK